ncbi:hypothetical protein N177_1197 [Lutibaculum baratangense AMV1]|uniref:Uncharacterized protein n=1 Tax=Lutibaculum baratangense AMV1 TaxID=631454 RepID=V4R1K6_9HYPH|nr:hypothetical protein N177_1197 [Lutibaculum baratangense AMV1]
MDQHERVAASVNPVRDALTAYQSVFRYESSHHHLLGY